MPSIYLKYSVDLDKDGKKDPQSIADSIGSIAKFLSNNGWRENRATIIKPIVKGEKYKSLKSKVLSRYSINTLKKYQIYLPFKIKDRAFYYIKLYNGKGYDIYLGDSNYRVITKYNYSKQYALANCSLL